MSDKENGTVDVVRSSYEIAWREYRDLPGLTPDENLFAPPKLRSYIQLWPKSVSVIRQKSPTLRWGLCDKMNR